MQSPTFAPGSLFSRIFHASPVAMCVTAPDEERCIDVNEAFAALVGRPREELIGQTGHRLCPLDVPFPPPPPAAGDPDAGQIYRLRAGDDDREVMVTTQAAEWEGRRVLITFVQDLLSFQATREALRASEERLRLFFDNMPVPIFVFDVETTAIVTANKRAAEHYGYDRRTLRTMTMQDIRVPEEREDWAYRAEGPADQAEHVGIRTHRKRDGSRISVDVTGYTLDLDGRRVRLVVAQDVTAKLAARESLREGEAYLQIMADVISDVIWDYDVAGGTLNFTSGLRTMYGYEGCERVTLDWWLERVHPDDRGEALDSFNTALAGVDSAWETQYRFRRFDGSYAYVLDRGYIMRDESGRATRALGIMVDITRQVALRDAADRAAQRERQRLARDLHDTVTQSLYSLSLIAEAARRRAIAGDRRAVVENVTRVGELAQQSLKEMYLLVYEFRPAALERDGLARALQARLDAVERRSGIQARLLVEPDEELAPEIQTQLFRVAEEALNNALKHASATAVWIHIGPANGAATMEIRDDGRGFDPAEAATSGGLGLISMKERVEKLGGRLEIVTAPGQGTIVRVYLDQKGEQHGTHDSDLDLR